MIEIVIHCEHQQYVVKYGNDILFGLCSICFTIVQKIFLVMMIRTSYSSSKQSSISTQDNPMCCIAAFKLNYIVAIVFDFLNIASTQLWLHFALIVKQEVAYSQQNAIF
jgi:hypothetical protein